MRLRLNLCIVFSFLSFNEKSSQIATAQWAGCQCFETFGAGSNYKLHHFLCEFMIFLTPFGIKFLHQCSFLFQEEK